MPTYSWKLSINSACICMSVTKHFIHWAGMVSPEGFGVDEKGKIYTAINGNWHFLQFILSSQIMPF
jgi:hypothetical protein